MKRRALIKHLKKHNCSLLREGAKHSIWINNITGQQTTIPRHREIAEDFAKEICKQLGIPFPKKG